MDSDKQDQIMDEILAEMFSPDAKKDGEVDEDELELQFDGIESGSTKINQPITGHGFDIEGNEKEFDIALDNLITREKNRQETSYLLTEEDLKPVVGVLPLSGIGPAVTNKLLSAGYRTLEEIAYSSSYELQKRSEIGSKMAGKIVQSARDALGLSFKSADQLLIEREQQKPLKIGVNSLDNLLGGGLEIGGITEFFGEFRTGKTQICMQTAFNTIRESLNGNTSEKPEIVIYIDTEGTFRPERIKAMAKESELDPVEILSRIQVGRAYNSDHQQAFLNLIQNMVSTNKVSLLIVDSLIAHFRSEYIGESELIMRQQELNKYLAKLRRIAETYRFPILVTNQVQVKPNELLENSIVPAGGNIVAHACTSRVFLRKAKGNKRIARLIDDPALPEAETVFRITENGVKEDTSG